MAPKGFFTLRIAKVRHFRSPLSASVHVSPHQSSFSTEKTGSPAQSCVIIYKNRKNPHFSMCRTFSPYKMKGIYFSLGASTLIKIATSHLWLLGEPSHTSLQAKRRKRRAREQKHQLLSKLKKQRLPSTFIRLMVSI